MKKDMTLTELKKRISEIDHAELKKLVCNLYKNSDMAEKMINAAILGDSYKERLLEQYKDKMFAVFFPKDIIRSGFSLSKAKSLISEFKNICSETEYILDLQLYYVECGTEFTNTFGDIDINFYNSMCKVYHTVIQAVNTQENDRLYQKFADRLYSIVTETDEIGWGYHDYVTDEFYNILWLEEEQYKL
mgnify:CR=1 FL=1